MRACFPILQVEVGNVAGIDTVGPVGRVQPDEMVGIAKRQGPDGDGIDHAEHGAVDADAERETEETDGGEARGLEQCAGGVAQILSETIHGAANMIPPRTTTGDLRVSPGSSGSVSEP